MKPLYSLFRVVAIVSMIVTGNSVFSQEMDNYYELQKKWNDYYRGNPEFMEEEDGDYQQFARWQEFWKNRIDSDDSLYRGKLTNFKRVWEQYRQSHIDCRSFNSGSYICKMNHGRKAISYGKFIIIR